MSEGPTGRTRHRIMSRFLRSPVLVLQEEWRVEGAAYYDPYDGGHVDGFVRHEWRDAQYVPNGYVYPGSPGS